MKIALVSAPFVPLPPPRYGGTELVVWNLAEELAARGHDVTVYGTGDSRVAGVDLRWRFQTAQWPPDAYRELDHAAAAMRDLIGERFDVIHAHVPSVVAMSWIVRPPIVCTIHHDRVDSICELYRRHGASVSFVAISERQSELMGDLPTRVIHHGLRGGLYPLGDGAGGGAAFLARFSEEKGPATAIDAAREAGVAIRLAGRPHEGDSDYYRAEVEPRLRQDGVTWIGEANHDMKVQLLGDAAALLAPIAWEEPFGLALVESMMCGTPVLGFAKGSLPEIIDPGVTGWIVDDVDEMAWRLRRLAKANDRFDRARCRARALERFSVERMTDRYVEIYRAACTGTLAAASP